MNKFEEDFFAKYITVGTKLEDVLHKHMITILRKVITKLLIVGIVFLIYIKISRLDRIPFYFIEIFSIIMYLILIYEIFDWYCDVWILTNKNMVDLKWRFFGNHVNTLDLKNIEGVEMIQDGLMDSILKKGNLIVNKIGGKTLIINDVFLPLQTIEKIDILCGRGQKETDVSEEIIEEVKKEIPSENKSETEIIIESLTSYVKQYLENNSVKKEENNQYLETIKTKKGTLDLTK